MRPYSTRGALGRVKEKGVSGRSMCKGLELREHGMSETTFNSVKLKKTVCVCVGRGGKVNAGEEGGEDGKSRPATHRSQGITPLASSAA